MHHGSPTEARGHQFVIGSEAIAENSLVFVAFCHNEYLIRPQHARRFADVFPPTTGLLESLHQDRGDVHLQPQATFSNLDPSCRQPTPCPLI